MSLRIWGVNSWCRLGGQFIVSPDIHHPFMLDNYTGSGYEYHDRFRSIGLKPEHASHVSFVEALDIPTCGSGTPPVRWLRREHLKRLEDWVRKGSARYVFIPSTTVNLLHRAKTFSWLGSTPIGQYRSVPILGELPGKTIFCPYHFSYRFAPAEERRKQLLDIGYLITNDE